LSEETTIPVPLDVTAFIETGGGPLTPPRKRSVDAVEWSLDGGSFNQAGRLQHDPILGWGATLPLSSRSVPKDGVLHTLRVRALDSTGHSVENGINFRAVDRTQPRLEVLEPGEGNRITSRTDKTSVVLTGTASDDDGAFAFHTGVEKVEWSYGFTDQWRAANPKALGDWSTWSAIVVLPFHGEHRIVVRCWDRQGNLTEVVRQFRTTGPFQVKDLSRKAYLKDLLDYSADRLWLSGDSGIDERRLANALYQPFAGLVAAETDSATRTVSQNRVCVEVLRDYLEPRPAALWTFDEGSGTLASDSSGNGHAGTLNGPAWRSTQDSKKALEFDGKDDYVVIGKPDDLAMTDAVTIVARVFPKGRGATRPRAA
jgi:hypothetical protein